MAFWFYHEPWLEALEDGSRLPDSVSGGEIEKEGENKQQEKCPMCHIDSLEQSNIMSQTQKYHNFSLINLRAEVTK